MVRRVLFAALIISLGGFLGLQGALAAEAPVLSLPQLMALALKYSPEVKATQSEVDLAKAQRDEARGYYRPQVETNTILTVVPNAREPIIKDGHVFFPDPANRIHGVNVFGRLDFAIIQPLYTFGKIAHRERAAERNVKVKQEGVEGKKGEVIRRLSEAYYGLILAAMGKDAVKEARTYLSDAKERITRLLSVGSTSVKETDRYRLAVYEGSVEQFSAKAEEGSKVAYTALKQMIGYGPGQDFQVGQEMPEPEAPKGTLDYYVRQALDLRPEFRQLKEGLVARQLLVDAAKADRYPSFYLAVIGALAGAPGRDQIAGPLRDPAIVDIYNTAYAAPLLGMKWNLDFGITSAKIRQARAELDQLRHTEKAALMGIPVEVAQAYGKVQENYKSAQAMQKSYVNARRWVITSFSNFDIGLGTMDEVFRAIREYGETRGEYLVSLFNYHVARADLDKATGAYRVALGELYQPEKKPEPVKKK